MTNAKHRDVRVGTNTTCGSHTFRYRTSDPIHEKMVIENTKDGLDGRALL